MRVRLATLVWIAAGLAAAALLVWAFLPRPVPVETAEVTRGRFVATVDEDGRTRVRERYVVAAPLAGRTTRIRLKVGDTVEAGDVIASILPSPAPLLDPRTRREAEERLRTAEADLQRTRALVDRARAHADKARLDLDRTRMLRVQGVATAQALERDNLAMQVAERDLRAAEFQHEATSHEVEQIKALIARYEQGETEAAERWSVTAPVAGVVLKVDQESETVVAPGTALVEIGDPTDLEVIADVLSTDAVEMRPGAEVAIERWGGPAALAGRLRRVEPAAFTKLSTLGVEEQRVNVLIDLVSPREQWADLGDGYRVEVRITVFSLDDATIVPTGALFRLGEDWHVFVVSDGRAERRRVEVLRRAARAAAIGAGLSPGDIVIVYPSDRIAPGVRVEVR
jgi:HlyD family secretion protein